MQFRAEQTVFRLQQQLNSREAPREDDAVDAKPPREDDDVANQIRMCIEDMRALANGDVAHQLNKTICRMELLEHTVVASHRQFKDILFPCVMMYGQCQCLDLETSAKHQPSRRDFKLCQMQNDMLQKELDVLRATSLATRAAKASTKTPLPSPSDKAASEPLESAIPAMRRDKLLRHLRAIEKVGDTPHLVLDLPEGVVELSNEVRQRVGLICIDIVARACVRFNVLSVIDLPAHLKHVRRLSRSVPMLFAFVEGVQAVADVGDKQKPATPRDASAPSPNSASLETLKDRLSFMVHDYVALQQHLAPPGRTIHLVLTKCMLAVHVQRLDDLVPTITDLVAVTATHRNFVDDLRQLLGLSADATRTEILNILRQYLQATLGLQGVIDS
ncbi:Aste57867_22448 [Aphanomyces stellatus]|uniref:Aste57867_22448 protein n=1 Tax=Aphanomyces stellatus TaxID=120398 RepID=A0A485LQ09_9STRA|nr:hypothetical protein As57867_022378 [Aphanomyces stellatus]VFT99108.1 Aste57867_22448 [Aphanomyces stellatus]